MSDPVVFNFFCKDEILKALCNHFDLNILEVRKFVDTHEDIDKASLDFVKKFHIRLDKVSVDNVYIKCKHVTTSHDSLESFKRFGALNLKDALEKDTPLRNFLADNFIRVSVTDKIMKYRDKTLHLFKYDEDCSKCFYAECRHIKKMFNGTHDITYKNIWCDYRTKIIPLIVKLFSHKSELEVHLAGSNDEIINYSCVKDYPEILVTIEKVIYKIFNEGTQLCSNWIKLANKKTYILEFEQKIKNFENINTSTIFNREYYFDEYIEACNYDSSEFDVSMMPSNFFSNIYLLDKSVTMLLCPFKSLYGQLYPNTRIEWNDIKIIEVM